MEVQVAQIDGVKFQLHARSHTVICDQPMENGGTDEGMTPPEFLLGSLGACAAFYAAEYLRARGLAKAGVSVVVTADKLKAPARIGNFQVRVESPVTLTPSEREGLMRSVEHCLVKNTLLNPPEIHVTLNAPISAEATV